MSNDQQTMFFMQVVTSDNDENDFDRITRQLRDEILELDVDTVKLETLKSVPQGAKSLDPVLLGALAVTVGPTVLPKFLEFLHDWVMRKENRTLKLKMQTEAGASLEIEIPETTSPVEVKKWIDSLDKALSKHKRKR